MSPLVSSIVLNYRTPKDAWQCTEALLRQTVADTMEILLVDNHSDDDSIGYLRNRARFLNDARVKVFESPENVGYGRGNTIAIREAQGEFLLIINPDNILQEDGLEKMLTVMQKDPTIGILAPKLLHEDGTVRDSTRSFPTFTDLFIKRTFLRHLFPERLHRYLMKEETQRGMRDVDWVAGACFLIRRDLYTDLGGFDARFFLFFEDTDLCRKCWKAGKRVAYFPDVAALDRKQRLSEGGFLALLTKKTARIHLWSALKYFWKWRQI